VVGKVCEQPGQHHAGRTEPRPVSPLIEPGDEIRGAQLMKAINREAGADRA
jgi:hypothetical protein